MWLLLNFIKWLAFNKITYFQQKNWANFNDKNLYFTLILEFFHVAISKIWTFVNTNNWFLITFEHFYNFSRWNLNVELNSTGTE